METLREGEDPKPLIVLSPQLKAQTPTDIFSRETPNTCGFPGARNPLWTGIFAYSPCRNVPYPRRSCEGDHPKNSQQCPCGREENLQLVLLGRLALLWALRAALARSAAGVGAVSPSRAHRLSPSPKASRNFSSRGWGGSLGFVLLFEREPCNLVTHPFSSLCCFSFSTSLSCLWRMCLFLDFPSGRGI